MIRTAEAEWNGTVKAGQGTITSESRVLDATPYSFRSRFEDGKETNPEELIASAHAGCFSMALSLFLEKAGYLPEKIKTSAKLTFDPVALAITTIHLTVAAQVPGISPELFAEFAEKAKAGCPVSKVLRAEITLDASLA
jgi:osmotically inducible protein OsmC